MRIEDRARQAAESARYRVGAGPGYIDVFAAIRGLHGFHLLRYPLPADSLEGAFVRRGEHRFILVNSTARLTRQRFTAAHEFGHAFLEPSELSVTQFEADLTRREDRAANRFAAHFLMDEASVREAASRAPVSDPIAATLLLMAQFDVSLEAAAIHLHDLELIDQPQLANVLEVRSMPLSKTAAAHGVPAPRSREADRAVDPGREYFEELDALRAAGLVAGERYEAIRTLSPTPA